MRKVVIHKAGSYGELRIEEHPDPRPGPGQVLVATEAAGVNYADCIVRMGLYESAKKFVGWPITPGFETSGTIAAVGSGVSDVAVGDRVFAVSLFDGYATHVVVPRHQVFPLPKGFDMAEAAGFPAVHMTAWYALCHLARPLEGRSVLVHSAAGGVGSALLQLVAILGARAVGVVGASHKVEAARALGAHAVIDKSSEDLWAAAARHAPSGYDVVLDANGAETLRGSYRQLGPGGRLVVYGFHTMIPRTGGRPRYTKLAYDFLRTPRFSPLDLCNDNKSVLAFNLSYLFHEKDVLSRAMRDLRGWIEDGSLKAPRVTRYPFEDVARAHRDIESGSTVGKLVLEMRAD